MDADHSYADTGENQCLRNKLLNWHKGNENSDALRIRDGIRLEGCTGKWRARYGLSPHSRLNAKPRRWDFLLKGTPDVS